MGMKIGTVIVWAAKFTCLVLYVNDWFYMRECEWSHHSDINPRLMDETVEHTELQFFFSLSLYIYIFFIIIFTFSG